MEAMQLVRDDLAIDPYVPVCWPVWAEFCVSFECLETHEEMTIFSSDQWQLSAWYDATYMDVRITDVLRWDWGTQSSPHLGMAAGPAAELITIALRVAIVESVAIRL